MNETTTNLSARDDALDALTLLLRRAETAGDERRLMQRDVLTQVHLLGIEGAAAYYFPESCGDAEEPPFDRGKNGELLRTIRNFRLLLETLAPFQSLRKNVFSGRVEWNGRALCDEDESRMLDFLETHYALKSERDLQHAVRLVAAKRAYHPVRERLASLPWDGKAHILPFLIRCMKAAPTAYSGECARLIFHCGVARIMEPGCKVDDVVILQGKQGCGKSTLVRWLALEDDWAAEVQNIKNEKDVGEALQGKWIVELGELSAFASNGTGAEEIKQFVSKQRDRYRVPYEKAAQDFPRQCVFIGTTNDFQPLRDRTGNRRFYPLRVDADAGALFENEAAIRREIAQCWAEAYHDWQTGRLRHAPDPKLLCEIERRQALALADDWRVGEIERYLAAGEHARVCVKQLWREALGEPGNPRPADSREIGRIMNQMAGWERTDQQIPSGEYRGQRCWFKQEQMTVNDFVEV